MQNPDLRSMKRRSCFHCQTHKYRCDKKDRCSQCTKHKTTCTYAGAFSVATRGTSRANLASRLNDLEDALTRTYSSHALNISTSPSNTKSDTENTSSPPSQSATQLGTNYDTPSEVSGQVQPEPVVQLSRELPVDSVGQLFFPATLPSDTNLIQLTPQQRQEVWSIFKENVDFLVKVLHRPTANELIDNGPTTREALALINAICLSAATSLTAEQCQSRLGHPKKALTTFFKSATESALSRANFLTTASLEVHQAFVLYINSVSSQNTVNLNCTLVRMALNLARCHGFHRDGSLTGLTPFESEIRRRLWWALVCIDFRYSEESDFTNAFAIYLENIQMPLNLNDDDISPTMTSLPQPRNGITEMTISLARMDLASMWRQIRISGCLQSYNGTPAEELYDQHKELIRTHHKHVTETYFCKDEIAVSADQTSCTPHQWGNMIQEAGKAIVEMVSNKMLIFAAETSFSESTIQSPNEAADLEASIRVLESHSQLCQNELTAQWSWYFKSYPPWRAMITVLAYLCHEQQGEFTRRAWQAMDSIYDAKVPQDIIIPGERLAQTALKLREQALALRIRQSLGRS